MSRSVFAFGSVVASVVLFVVVGCSPSTTEPAQQTAVSDSHNSTRAEPHEEHAHKPGAHGGIIVSLGRDNYHVEAIITDKGEIRLYTLGNDETRVMDVEKQDLVAYVKSSDGSDAVSVDLKPQPQPGDAEGKASLFVGQLPDTLVGQDVDVTVPNITIGGERFRLGFTTKTDDHGESIMPDKVGNAEERELYLTPGGAYTQADIDANGNITASQKFVGFHASHDLHPKVGDKICPVTLTLANPECTWIIGGKTYEFCCPPCVDEFLALAKTNPEKIKEPDYYRKQDKSDQVH